MARRMKRSLTEGPLFTNIILYTIPIILTSILQLLFNAADLVVVGRFCGSISVAAVGATGSISNLLVNFFIGLSVGTGVTVAQEIGAGNNDEVHKTVHTAVPAAIICGLFLTVVGIVFCPDLLRIMGTPEDVLPLSTTYMRIYFGGITFTMIYNFCASILRAAGDTKSPLIYLTIAGIANVILNVVFVTLFDMNVAGVALATSISQAIAAVLVVLALMSRDDACRLFCKKLRIYKNQLLKIIRIGLPAGIQSSLFSISNVIIQSSINSFGSVFMSGNAAASNIEGFVYVIMNAFHHTALNFIGQNLGAKKYHRIKKIFFTSLICVFVAGFISGASAYIFGESLLSIYITDSPKAISYGMIRLAYLCLPYCLCGLMDVSTGALRGMGSSVSPMVISILGVCGFRVFWIYTIFAIPALHTPECLFFSYTISWIITFLIQFAAFLMVFKRKTSTEQINSEQC